MKGLTFEQVNSFREDGFLVLPGLLEPSTYLDPVIEEYEGVLDALAGQLHVRGETGSAHIGLPFAHRFMRIVAETGRTHAQHFDLSLPQTDVESDTPFWTGPAVFSLLIADPVLDAVESLIGPEVYSNPVQHVRIKPPEHLVSPEEALGQHALGATSWHQDNGVLTPDADDSEIITVWIPLTRATERHGCLQVIPGSHRGEIHVHCPGSAAGLEIPETVLPRSGAVALPMDRGDALLIHRRTAHASLPNLSDEIRWSLDLRYNPIGHATGRAAFPGFMARSTSRPVLRDPAVWADLWNEARRSLSRGETPVFNRWDTEAAACA